MVFVADGAERLDRFIARMAPQHSRTKLAKLIGAGEVSVDGVAITRPSFQLAAGQRVELEEPPETPPHNLEPVAIPLDVRYEDEVLLVVNKPRGMASHPAPNEKDPTLVNALLARSHDLSTEGGAFRPGIVHRLDKDTTGLMMVAKTDAAHRKLADQIRAKTAERRYFAVVHGKPQLERFTIDAPLGRHPGMPTRMAVRNNGRNAITHVKVLTRLDAGTLLALRLETGRTHQIRVHLAEFGLPVLGDRLYGRKGEPKDALQLHAAYLAFTHPVTAERVVVYADPPEDFLGCDAVARELIERWS